MAPLLKKSKGSSAIRQWDRQDPLRRLYFVLKHSRILEDLGLVSQNELRVANALSESSREYILAREDQPLFADINLRLTLEQQQHKERLMAALEIAHSGSRRTRGRSRENPSHHAFSSSRLRLS